jgi:hypothetical protein
VRERERMGMGRGRKGIGGGGDVMSGRRYEDDRWITFEASILAREGERAVGDETTEI